MSVLNFYSLNEFGGFPPLTALNTSSHPPRDGAILPHKKRREKGKKELIRGSGGRGKLAEQFDLDCGRRAAEGKKTAQLRHCIVCRKSLP